MNALKLNAMPHISDEELLDYKVQIEDAKEEKRVTDYAHTKKIRDEKENTKKFKIATIILGIIALIGIAGTIYFMNFYVSDNLIEISKANAQKKVLQDKINTLEEDLKTMAMNQEINESAALAEQNRASLSDEIIYAVQVGAFQKKDLSMYSDKFVNFKEIKDGNFNKYALGNFASLSEAKEFRKELVRLGFRNAFIASYQNGERLKIEEAW
ncbi:hypothetical protein GCM10022393_37610 [Aquimarina addita]|uniref:SPOR domain-containing protein n=1 Tax=Aquimarina addita TaxID=870485 RepID=A0ABP6UUI5_9FLAO